MPYVMLGECQRGFAASENHWLKQEKTLSIYLSITRPSTHWTNETWRCWRTILQDFQDWKPCYPRSSPALIPSQNAASCMLHCLVLKISLKNKELRLWNQTDWTSGPHLDPDYPCEPRQHILAYGSLTFSYKNNI